MSKKQVRSLILSPVLTFFAALVVLLFKLTAFAESETSDAIDQPPQFKSPAQLQVTEGSIVTIKLSDYFIDPEGEELAYAAGQFKDFLGNSIGDGSLPQWLNLDVIEETLIASPNSGDVGAYIAEIEAYDPQTQSVVGKIEIYVLVDSTKAEPSQAVSNDSFDSDPIITIIPVAERKTEVLGPSSPPSNYQGPIYLEEEFREGQYGPGGFFRIEAEKYSSQNGYDSYSWQEYSGYADTSSGVALRVTPSSTFAYSGLDQGLVLKYDLLFVGTGNYSINVRGQSDSDHKRFTRSIDGRNLDSSERHFSPYNTWKWENIGAVQVDEPGLHTVSIHLRSSGLAIDSLIVSRFGYSSETGVVGHSQFPSASPIQGASPVTVDQGLPDQSTTVGSSISFGVPSNAFNNQASGSLEYNAIVLPPWLSFDGTNFTGTPQEQHVGTNGIQVVATNEEGQSVYESFSIHVSPNGEPAYGRILHIEEDLPGETGGLVLIEAETFSHKHAADGRQWMLQESTSNSGGAYLKSDPYGSYSAPGDMTGAVVTYDVLFRSTGTYELIYKVNRSYSSGSSLDIGFDGQLIHRQLDATNNRWSGYVHDIVIDKPGVHTLSVWLRGGTMELDAFALSRGDRYFESNSTEKLDAESPIQDAPYVDQGIAAVSANSGQSQSLSIPSNAFGGGNGTLTHSMESGPAWLSFDGATFTGTPADSDYGINKVSVRATDQLGLAVSTSFYFVVGSSTTVYLEEDYQTEYYGPGGLFRIEAENYSAKHPYNSYSWEPYTGFSDAGRGVSMKVSPSSSFSASVQMTGPALKYDLLFVGTGEYRISVRGQAPSDHNHLGLAVDGQFIGYTGRHYHPYNQWEWESYHSFDIDEPGLHTVGLYLRNDGLSIDSIIISRSSSPSAGGVLDNVSPLPSASPIQGASPVTVDQGVPDQIATAGFPVSFGVPSNAFDNQASGSLEYNAIVLPSWLSFDGTTFTGTPLEQHVGTSALQIVATNGEGMSVYESFSIHVSPNGEPAYGRVLHVEEDLPGETGGLVRIEAETFSYTHAAEGRHWEEYLSTGRSGGASMRSEPNSAYTDSGDMTGPALKYDILFTSAGDYFLSFRSDRRRSGSSILFALDGQKVQSCYESTSMRWINSSQTTPKVKIKEPGVHTLSVWLCAGSMDLDAITLRRGGNHFENLSTNKLEAESPIQDAPYVDQGIANVSVNPGQSQSLSIPSNAFSGGNGTVTHSMESGPAWLSFDGTTFTGTPANSDYGVNKVTVAATDQLGIAAVTTFSFIVGSSANLHLEEEWRDGAYGPGGLFRIEAEKYSQKYSYSSYSWEEYNGYAGFGGDTAMRVNPTSTYVQYQEGDAPTLNYDLMFVGTGRYYVNVRGLSSSGSRDVGISVDGEYVGKTPRSFTAYGEWDWERFQDFEIDEPGLHTVSLHLHNGNLTVDSIIVSRSSSASAGGVLDDASPLPSASPIQGASPVTVDQGVPDQIATVGFPVSFGVPSNAFDNQASGSLEYNAIVLPSWLSFDGTTFTGTPLEQHVGTSALQIVATNGEGMSVYESFSIHVSPNGEPAYGRILHVEEDLPGETGGLVRIEAETYSHTHAAEGRHWEKYLSTGRSGGASMRSEPNSAYTDSGDMTGPALKYDILFTSAGDYFLSFRSDRRRSGSSILFAFDGQKVQSCYESTSMRWINSDSIKVNEPGVHTLSIWLCASSMEIDSVALRRNEHIFENLSYDKLDAESPIQGAPYVDQGIADRLADIGEAVSFTIPANAFGGGNGTLTYSIESGPAWLSFDGTTFTGTPADTEYGVNKVTVAATDQLGIGATTTFAFVVYDLPPNNPPIVDQGIANQTTNEAVSFNLSIPTNAFSDPDGDPLTLVATTLPAWLNFDGSSFTGTPLNEDVGLNNVTLQASDPRGGSVSLNFSIDVINTNDPPVVDQGISNQSAIHEVPFSYTIPSNAFSDPDGDMLTLTATILPSWLSFNGSAISGTPQQSHIGGHDVVIEASDPSQQKASIAFRVLVSNDAPESGDLSDTNLSLLQGSASGLEIPISATDPEDGNITITSSNVEIIQPTNGTVAWNASSGKWEYTPNSGYIGSDTFQFRVLDSHNEPSAWQTVTVRITVDESQDADADGLPDGWETYFGLNPNSATGSDGAGGNTDADLFSNRLEYLFGTNPNVADTPSSQSVPITILTPIQ